MIHLVLSLFLTVANATDKKTIRIDGSSTVFPITEAVAEEFSHANKDIQVTVGVSGTGGGFKKFTINETDINDASRTIDAKEVEIAKKNGVEYLEIPIAYDGITVITNPKNTWAKDITTTELKKIWEPDSKVKTWKDIRASWPDKEIRLYGPGVDSGTFDYFTEAINGKSHVSRSNFTKSEDDNVLVKAVAGDTYALAFLGFAYYKENKNKLNALAINNGKATVAPTEVTINDGTYAPLSRKVFIYVSKKSLQRPEVAKFLNFYIANVPSLSKEVGYTPLQKEEYTKVSLNLKNVVK
ncbi:MAG: PstS family phosphate ABC transporter substrate-binding protein [Bdellovibrionales bacterium]|nr:PstS family phosphate ABC transporter substrate-binding protein [Bdellovibrionales bacterium]